jgi:D-tyrosyl-tRNA(Tyr) deacylase
MWSNGPVRALVQRVASASVDDRQEGDRVGEIGPGLLAFVGVTHDDGGDHVARLADKLWHLRVFPDDRGPINRSLAERCAAGEPASILGVSQFTLYGDTRKGRRPSFVDAARPEVAEPLIEELVDRLAGLGATVATGRFGADMEVRLVNDGPVTLLLEV